MSTGSIFGELLPVGTSEDDAVGAQRQCGGEKSSCVCVCLVSVALPGTCRWRTGGRGRGFLGSSGFGCGGVMMPN